MPLADSLDKKLKTYWTFSAAVLDGVSDEIANISGGSPIYITCTGGTVLVETRNGQDLDYASEGGVVNSTAILHSPHITALRVTASGGDAFVTVSITREHHGRL